jgi:type I restriction enzyme R subunit
MASFYETDPEEAVLSTLSKLGWQYVSGAVIAPGEPAAERGGYDEVLLAGRLRAAIARLNPGLPEEARAETYCQVSNLPNLHPTRDANNRAFHKILVEGVDVSYQEAGQTRNIKGHLVDFENPNNNEFLAVNQFTIKEQARDRRMDIVLFVNGLPLGLIELKSQSNEKATLKDAFDQLQTYKQQIPTIFVYNEVCILSDGINAMMGSYLAPGERFMPWRAVNGVHIEAAMQPGLDALLAGALPPANLLNLLRHFIAFADTEKGLAKILQPTGASAWCGTPKGPASRSPCSSMRARSLPSQK